MNGIHNCHSDISEWQFLFNRMQKICLLLLLSYHFIYAQQDNNSDVKVTYEVYKIVGGSTLVFSSTLLLNAHQSSFIYTINDTPAAIRETKEQEFEDVSLNIRRTLIDTLTNSYYFDHRHQIFVRSVLDFSNNKKMYIRDSIPKQKWELSKETKRIHSFDCTKAVLDYKGNRYYAWFTREIPTTFGPFEFGQLPGLILELHSEDYRLYMAAKKIVFPHKELIVFPDANAEYISGIAYDRLLQQYQDSITGLIETKARRILTKSDRSVNISNIKIKIHKTRDSSKIRNN